MKPLSSNRSSTLFELSPVQKNPDCTAPLPPLHEGVPRFLFIAPLQRITRSFGPDEFEIELYELPDNALSTNGIQQEFVSRDEFNSPFTQLNDFRNILSQQDAQFNQELVEKVRKRGYHKRDSNKQEIGAGFHFTILGGEVYEHMGMLIVALMVEVSDARFGDMSLLEQFNDIFYPPEDRSDPQPGGFSTRELIEQFEQASTYFVKHFCREYLFGKRQYYVRWVGRTMIYLGDSEIDPPDEWFQGIPDQSPVELEKGTYAQAGWGNNVARTDNANFQFIDLRRSAVMAQYVWCYLNDIDTRSVEILSRARRSDHKERVDFDQSLSDLIDLNYDLATASMFNERLGTESSVANRELVESILDAWGFSLAFELTSARLERLESILQARTEMRGRRTSTLMEWILFGLSITGILSLILGLIGTAFSGESGTDEPWFPHSWFLNIFRSHIDFWVVLALVASTLLFIWVFRFRRAPADPRRSTRVTVQAARFDDSDY